MGGQKQIEISFSLFHSVPSVFFPYLLIAELFGIRSF